MPSGPQDDSFNLWLIACIVFAIGGVSGGALGVVWIYVQADFQVTLSALGALVSAATVGRTITSTISGPVIGRLGVANVMMGGVAFSAISMLGFALAPSWPFFMLAAAGTGFGSGIMSVGLNAFAAVQFSARRMNWLHGSFGIGSTVGPFIVTIIVLDLGIDWRWIYLLFTALRVFVFFLFFVTRREWRISEAKTKAGRSAQAAFGQTLRLPIIWLMIGAWLMATGNELVAGQFANNFFIEARAIDPKVAGAWVSLYWASLTASRFFAGFIIKWVKNSHFLRFNIISIMAGAALLGANLSPTTSLIGLAIIGFSIGPFAPLMSSDTPLRVGGRHVANTMGLQFTGASLGMAILPWLAGSLAETIGLEIIPFFVFASALLTFFLHEAILWRDLRHPIPKIS